MAVDTRQLRYFLAVAEAGNLSRAAEKLFIAQPPLSVQIRQLEEELELQLFVRHPKGVHLTAAGERLLPEARHLVERLAGLKERMHGDAQAGSLALGYVPSAGSTVLPELLRALRMRHPGLQLELREMISSEQMEALVAGTLDAGLVRTEPRHPRLSAAARIADPFCIAVPADDAAQGGGPVRLQAFARSEFVAFTRHRGPAYFDQSIHLCARAGFSPRIRYEASTIHGVLDLVGAGLGVALVPASCALLKRQGVLLRPLQGAHAGQVLALVRRNADGHPLLPALQKATAAIFRRLQKRLGASS